MRKPIIHILAITAILTACTAPKDNAVPSTGAKVDLTLKITSVSPSTKTFIEKHSGDSGASYGLKWSKGDKMGLLIDSWETSGKPAIEMENTASSGENAIFQGLLRGIPDGSHTLYTYSPVSALIGTEKDNKLNFTIPSEQHISGDSFDPSADIVVGKGYKIVVKADNPVAEIADIRFTRLLATVMVTASNKGSANLEGESLNKITLISKMQDAALSGSIQWDCAGESLSVESANNTVTAILEKPIPIDGTTPAYILINPTTLAKGSSLIATIETGKYRITKTISSLPQDLSFPGNNISALNLSITDADSVIEEI